MIKIRKELKMTIRDIIDEIKLELTGGVLELEIVDDTGPEKTEYEICTLISVINKA